MEVEEEKKTILLAGANERKTILLVDDNMTILAAGKSIMKELYKAFPVLSAGIMFDLL